MTEAYKNGWLAHKAGQPLNPYNPLNQRYSHYQWRSGWRDRFSAVKHDEKFTEEQSEIEYGCY